MSDEIEPGGQEAAHHPLFRGRPSDTPDSESDSRLSIITHALRDSAADRRERTKPKKDDDADVDYLGVTLEICSGRLNEKNFEDLRSRYGAKIVNYRGRHGRTLLHEALLQRNCEIAERIFELAAESGVPIDMCWDGGDILQLALQRESRDCVEYALKKLTGKCGTVQQTGQILARHFKSLIAKYPMLVEDYLMHDRFCFEYGRFCVPSRLFNRKTPIAMTTDDQFDWTAKTSEEAESFWRRNSEVLANCPERESDTVTTAVAKFACIQDAAHRGLKKSIPSRLLSSKVSVEVFKSNLISLLVQWKWNEYWKARYVASFVLQIMNVVAFLFFAANFGFEADGEENIRWLPISLEDGPVSMGTWNGTSDGNTSAGTWGFNKTAINWTAETWDLSTDSPTVVARWALSISVMIGISSIGLRVIPPSRLLSLIVKLILWSYCINHESHTRFTVFLTSVECVYASFSILWFFQAFRCTGALTSLVWYSILDARAFIVFVAVVMAGFAEAMHVLHGNKFRGDDGGNYLSPTRSFESLGYSMLGEFDESVFRTNSSNLNDYLDTWRTALFDLFIFLGPVLMLALLVSILGDTYDRVKITEIEEQNKARARVIHVSERMNRWIQKILPALKERRLGSKAHTSVPELKFQKTLRDAYVGLAGEKERQRKYFHYLVPVERQDNVRDSSWHGKLNALERMMGDAVERSENSADKSRKKLERRLDKIEEQIVELRSLFKGDRPSRDSLNLRNDSARA